MNKLFIYMAIGFLLLASNQLFGQQNLLLPDKFFVKYPVDIHPDSLHSVDAKQFKGLPAVLFTDSISLNKEVVSLLKDSSNTFYSYDGGVTTPIHYNNIEKNVLNYESILERLGSREEVVEVEIRPGLFLDSVCKIAADWNSISELLFTEEWKLDTVKNVFIKQVHSILPVSRRSYHGEDLRFLVGDMILDYSEKELQELRENAIHIERIKYEYCLNLTEKLEHYHNVNFQLEDEFSPYMNSVIKKKLINYLVNRIQQKTFTAYDFYTVKPIKKDEAMKQIGSLVPVEMSPGVFTHLINTGKIDYESIHSLVFIEDWYINPEPFMIFKEVVGMGPIMWRDEFDERNEIPFVIYFNKKKKF